MVVRPRLRLGNIVWLAALAVIGAERSAGAGGLTFVQSHNTSAEAFAMSPDGMNMYVTRGPDKLQVYTRSPITGVLTLLEEQENGVGGVDGIRRAKGVAVTPDGACVYASTDFDDKVAAFSRNGGTGALTFVGVKEEGVGGVTGLEQPKGVVVSPDSLDVYVAGEIQISGPNNGTVVAFRRTPPSCALAYVETELGDGDGLERIDASDGITVSGDGKNVYVTGRVSIDNNYQGTVNVLTRNAMTGALTFFERRIDNFNGVELLSVRVRAVAESPGGTNLYALSSGDDSIVVFSRDTGNGHLQFVEALKDGSGNDGLKSPRNLVVSPDGAYVYVSAFDDDSIAVFRRETTTGTLRFLEVHKDPDINPPNDVLGGGGPVALSPAGEHLYVGSRTVLFAVDTCGNGNLGPDEQCDDGNATSGDGCSSTCRLELCGPLPTAGCRSATPFGGAQLQIKDQTEDRKDQLKWKWAGQATTIVEYGNPVTTASYVICIYDSSANPQPLVSRAAPLGGTCAGKPCWTTKPTSDQYADKILTPDGVKKVKLKEGLVDGKPKIQVQGVGVYIEPPALPLTLPVTVQVKNTQTGVCWDAVYSSASKNDAAQFKAKSD